LLTVWVSHLDDDAVVLGHVKGGEMHVRQSNGDTLVSAAVLPSSRRKLPSVARRRRRVVAGTHKRDGAINTKSAVATNASLGHCNDGTEARATTITTKTPTFPAATNSHPSTFIIEAPITGLVKSHNLEKVAPLTYQLRDVSSKVLLTLAPCNHSVVLATICSLCGEQLSESQLENYKKIEHGNQELLVREELAVNMGTKERERLFRQRKLSLVLDLDHTLFHATPDALVDSFLEEYKYHNGKECEDILRFFLDKHRSHAHFVKLRPHLFEFLEEASKLFELHIVTHGTKLYAKAMSKIIDPTKKYFANRIIAREDCEKEEIKVGAKCFTEMNWETGEYQRTQSTTNKWMKKISHLFPQGVHTVLIIDDTVEVWREEYDNVLQIKPYHFFVGSRDVNNAAGTKMSTGGRDVDDSRTRGSYFKHISKLLSNDKDNELLVHLEVLKRLHRKFFNQLDTLKREKARNQDTSPDNVVIDTSIMPHMNHLLSLEKEKTFQGCHFLFSRVFPLTQNPTETSLWKDAEKFGAQCHIDFNDHITHVITNQRGTDKVKQALKTPGVFVVHANWLFESKFRFEAQNEFDYFMYSNDMGGRAPLCDRFPGFEELSRVEDGARDLVYGMHQFRQQLSKLKRYSEGEEQVFEEIMEEGQTIISDHPPRHKQTADDVMKDIEDELANPDHEEDFDALFDEEFDKMVNNEEDWAVDEHHDEESMDEDAMEGDYGDEMGE